MHTHTHATEHMKELATVETEADIYRLHAQDGLHEHMYNYA